MDKFLTLSLADRRQLCDEVGNQIGIAAAAIEKDFWICWTLRELFSLPEIGSRLTFKGGTSLSKGWKLIDRFSEDIDIVIDRDSLGFGGDKLTKNQLNQLQKRCQRWIEEVLLPSLRAQFAGRLGTEETWTLEIAGQEDNQSRETLLFAYPRLELPSGQYLQPIVRIECGARSDTEPSETPPIAPYLFEVYSEVLGPSEFSVRTVAARRTFLDKAMILHEVRTWPPEKPRSAKLVRHFYDVWRLIGRGIGQKAIDDPGLFERVAHYRESFWPQAGVDYSLLSHGQLRMLPKEEQLEAWTKDYETMREMIFGEFPRFDTILEVMRQFEDEFNARSEEKAVPDTGASAPNLPGSGT